MPAGPATTLPPWKRSAYLLLNARPLSDLKLFLAQPAIGLPGVLAHGMLTMGFAVQPVIDWIGDPGRILDYQVRFTRPVPVDAADGARLAVVAKVGSLDVDTVRIDLTVTFDGTTVLGKAQVRVSVA